MYTLLENSIDELSKRKKKLEKEKETLRVAKL
jgi:hypothetical protein